MIAHARKHTREEVLRGYQKTVAAWQGSPAFTPALLAERFSKTEKTPDFLYMPTTFDLREEFAFMPFSKDAHWKGLEQTIRSVEPRAVVSLLPMTFQMNPLVCNSFKQLRQLGTPAKPTNLPLAVEIIRQLGADLVVVTPEIAQSLFFETPEVFRLSVRAWHVLVRPENARARLTHLPLAVRDLHVLPGVSVAIQCVHLAAKGPDRFHPAQDVVLEEEEGELYATSVGESVPPLLRVPVTKGVLRNARCACGETTELELS